LPNVFRLESSLVSILQLNLLQDNEEGGEDYSNENGNEEDGGENVSFGFFIILHAAANDF
jgi:hypothetical protein